MNSYVKVNNRLRRGTLDAFLTRLISFFVLFLLQIVLSRALGPKEYGTYSYVITIVGVLSVVVPLGWSTSVMRYFAEYYEKKDWSHLKGFIVQAFHVTLIAASVTAIILYGVSLLSSLKITISASLAYSALLLPVASIFVLQKKLFQALSHVKSSVLPDEVLLPMVLCVAIYLLPITSATSALRAYIIIAFAILLGSLVRLWKSLPNEIHSVRSKFLTKTWMFVALPMLWGSISQIAMNKTDLLMIGAIIDMNAVGLYSIANRIAVLNVFVLTAVNTIAVPVLASAYQNSDKVLFKSVLIKSMFWSSLGALPLVVLMFVYSDELLMIFGLEFIEAEPILKILAIGHLVNALTGSVGFGLLVSGKERYFALSMGVAAVFNLIGNLYLIPIWGAIGAAYVTAITISCLNIAQLWYLWHKELIAPNTN